jgi:hypothetical protein
MRASTVQQVTRVCRGAATLVLLLLVPLPQEARLEPSLHEEKDYTP